MNKTRFWALPLLFLLVIFLLPTNNAQALLDENNADPGDIGNETGDPTGPGGGGGISPTLSVSVTPTSISSGQTVTFSWNATYASSCVGSRGGSYATSGSFTDNPTSLPKTYTLTCSGSSGSVTKSATVSQSSVSSQSPTLSVSVTPTSISSGQTVTFSWNATNATSCTGSRGGSYATSGTFTDNPTSLPKTYTLTCSGSGGSVTQSATVSGNTTSTRQPPVTRTPSCNGENCNLFPVTVKSILDRLWVWTPFPYHISQTGESCSLKENYGCWPITNNGKKLYPYKAPIIDFVGRYVDGGGIGEREPWRGITGPEMIKTSNSRVYMLEGETLVAYNLNNFFSRLASEQLRFFYRKDDASRSRYVEAAIAWESYFYPPQSDWITYKWDVQDVLYDFDVDDRGYVYPATFWGWGILRDTGSGLQPVMQAASSDWINDSSKHTPFVIGNNKVIPNITGGGHNTQQILSFKSGGNYYLMVDTLDAAGSGNIHFYNVTDPLNPSHLLTKPGSWTDAKKISTSSGDVVAILKNNSIEIYNANTLISGGAPEKTFSPPGSAPSRHNNGYVSLASDGTSRFFSVGYRLDDKSTSQRDSVTLSVFSAGGSGASSYSEIKHSIGLSTPVDSYGVTTNSNEFTISGPLSYNDGYLVAVVNKGVQIGSRAARHPGIKMWVFSNGVPNEIDFDDYFLKHYSYNTEGYATNSSNSGSIINAMMVRSNNKDYLFVSTSGQADVYEIDPQASDAPTPPQPTGQCSDGVDNDGDGLIDSADPNCVATNNATEFDTSTPTGPTNTTLDEWLAQYGNKSCAEVFATQPYLIPLCEQLEDLQARTCSIMPTNPYCIIREQYNP